jgi:asparagine synthase (glutamine-hydrolysing)
MCGILGIAATVGQTPSLNDAAIERLRDLLIHRGPDGAGLWRHRNVVLAHRRLAVIDPTPAGAQPMVLHDADGAPRFALTYNGELYNDAELRDALQRDGVQFKTACDTETVLHVLARYGPEGIAMLRGMFALAFLDVRTSTLLLARDPLGVKPLYFANSGGELLFASEPRPLVEQLGCGPDMSMVSAYLTSIRTTLHDRTLFEGVHVLPPGHLACVDLHDASLPVEPRAYWRGPRESDADPSNTRACIEDALLRHLRSDVPTCALLSGGIDSTITAGLAAGHIDDLRTYCAGARTEDEDPEESDLTWAARVAERLGTNHAEAIVDASFFRQRWHEMVAQMGVPLSTPNEVAINTVASRLRADGCVVTISGEGADELFAGYDLPLRTASEYLDVPKDRRPGPGVFSLSNAAWIAPDVKPTLLQAKVRRSLEQDAWLHGAYEAEFARCAEESGSDGLGAHQRLLRRINLTGLLQRLDTATMLASVEGRTPFADARVATFAESIPMHRRIDLDAGRTKIPLREAFTDIVPPGVVTRAKRSFPLPFRQWMESTGETIRHSDFLRSMFRADAIELVASRPAALWNLAWPMANIALWASTWWGAAPEVRVIEHARLGAS